EENECALVRLSKPPHVDVLEAAGLIEPAQSTIHHKAKVLVASCERKRKRLVREGAVENRQIVRRLAALCCVEKDVAVSEKDIGPTIDPSLDTGAIAVHGRDSGVDLELVEPVGQPLLARGPRDDRECLLIQNQCRCRSPKRFV